MTVNIKYEATRAVYVNKCRTSLGKNEITRGKKEVQGREIQRSSEESGVRPESEERGREVRPAGRETA